MNTYMGGHGLVWYRVAFRGGVDVRFGPDVNSQKVGFTLAHNEIFSVCETVQGVTPDDLRVYLRLSDGRGWVFDDSAIYPQDPSVKRGHWQMMQQMVSSPCVVTQPAAPAMAPLQNTLPVTTEGYVPMAVAPQGYMMPPQSQMCSELCAPLEECGAGCYPEYGTQMPRRWKRGKRGGAKRRPKTQV